MTGQADSLAREDAILWRWPAGPWEWLRAGALLWGASKVVLLGIGLGIAIGAGITVKAYLSRNDLPDLDAILMGAGVSLFVGITLVLAPAAVLYASGYLRVPRLTLTARAVRVEFGLPWRRVKTLPRSEIHAAVVYEGDGTVALRGETGELMRLHHVGEVAAFAEALAVPTLAWTLRKPSMAVQWLTTAQMVFMAVIPFVAAVATLVLINVVAPEWVPYLPRIFGGLAGAVLGGIAAGLLAPIPVLAIGRLFVTPQTLDEFIAGLIDFARLQGRGASRIAWPDKTFAAGAHLAMRILRIDPPLPLQPELRHGATPEMAVGMAAWNGSSS
jgi:hypothetical protein